MIARIVARTNLDDFTDEVLNSFWDRPEYRRFRPHRDDVRAWVRWNIELVIRWLVDGHPPSQAELDQFRDRARARAADGMPADVVPANFRRGARFAWTALLDAAREDERPALLDSADLMFEYVDRVSQLFSDTYEGAATAVTVSSDERSARTLLARLIADGRLTGEDHQLAERIGFAIRSAYRPFVVVAAGLSAQQHAALATALRARHALATTEGRRVIGLGGGLPIAWTELGLGPAHLRAEADLTVREQLSDALDELRMVAEIGEARGVRGRARIDDFLPELLLRRSPRLAARTRRRVYGPLDAELARTLDLLIENDFDRAATAAMLPAHRNTLTNRLARIRELAGVDVDRSEGRGLAWLAWLERTGDGRPAA
ncbi:MAG: hypothetical protein QOJ07_1948 [Thermoleophilaceae bacterium]|nr:hypothetical protein [Thermoleophilaceae bacterium]